MGHVIEQAASGRAKCRSCGRRIEKAELRLGERMPNPFADEGEATFWFHLVCGALQRPEPFLEALAETEDSVPQRDWLETEARRALRHRRIPRMDGAERAASGRATCRACRETIAKDAWRVRLVFWDEGRFDPGGFVHVGCIGRYCETEEPAELLERLLALTPDASADDRAALAAALGG